MALAARGSMCLLAALTLFEAGVCGGQPSDLRLPPGPPPDLAEFLIANADIVFEADVTSDFDATSTFVPLRASRVLLGALPQPEVFVGSFKTSVFQEDGTRATRRVLAVAAYDDARDKLLRWGSVFYLRPDGSFSGAKKGMYTIDGEPIDSPGSLDRLEQKLARTSSTHPAEWLATGTGIVVARVTRVAPSRERSVTIEGLATVVGTPSHLSRYVTWGRLVSFDFQVGDTIVLPVPTVGDTLMLPCAPRGLMVRERYGQTPLGIPIRRLGEAYHATNVGVVMNQFHWVPFLGVTLPPK